MPADRILSYRTDRGGGHVRMTLWVNGANIGTLTVRDDEVSVLQTLMHGSGAIESGSRSTDDYVCEKCSAKMPEGHKITDCTGAWRLTFA